MTTAEFIASVEAKPQFIKWAVAPVQQVVVGGVGKWEGTAYVRTPNGTNLISVWFIVDEAGQATWQNQDTIDPSKNVTSAKEDVLNAYLKATFVAHFILRADLTNNWAEADVYTISGTDLAKSTVLVFKQGANPITHRKIV